MGVSAQDIYKHKLVDSVIPEPLGGAHRHLGQMVARPNKVLVEQLNELKQLSIPDLVDARYQKLMAMGACD